MKPSNLLFYSTEDQNVKVSVHFQNGTFWLTQKTMAALFAVNVPVISKHLKNIFETKELEENAIISILETTKSEDLFQSLLQRAFKGTLCPKVAFCHLSFVEMTNWRK